MLYSEYSHVIDERWQSMADEIKNVYASSKSGGSGSSVNNTDLESAMSEVADLDDKYKSNQAGLLMLTKGTFGPGNDEEGISGDAAANDFLCRYNIFNYVQRCGTISQIASIIDKGSTSSIINNWTDMERIRSKRIHDVSIYFLDEGNIEGDMDDFSDMDDIQDAGDVGDLDDEYDGLEDD